MRVNSILWYSTYTLTSTIRFQGYEINGGKSLGMKRESICRLGSAHLCQGGILASCHSAHGNHRFYKNNKTSKYLFGDYPYSTHPGELKSIT